MTSPEEFLRPDEYLDSSDPGDDIQRRFRYQHAYGVILLAASAAGRLPYTALWAEHHDDYACDCGDGHFESFQIKTSKPERGPIKTQDENFLDAIRKFVALETRFDGRFKNYNVVFNAEFYDTSSASKIAQSPSKFLNAVARCDTPDDLPPHFRGVFEDYCRMCSAAPEAMLHMLKKVRLQKGPGLDSFDDEVAHTHLPSIPGCSHLTAAQLNGLRDELISRIFRASSLAVGDPAKHWSYIGSSAATDPTLLAKRIRPEDIKDYALQTATPPFRFFPADPSISVGHKDRTWKALDRKLVRAGLASQVPTMKRRALSAERHLLEMTISNSDNINSMLDQFHGVVKSVCDDAYIIALAQAPEPFGPLMLSRVIDRLQHIASHESLLVYSQGYDFLAGLAALLTDDCQIWWGTPFDLSEEK